MTKSKNKYWSNPYSFLGLTHLKFLNKLFSIRSRHYDMALGWLNETIVHCFVNKSEKVVVVPINIQEAHLYTHSFGIDKLGFAIRGAQTQWVIEIVFRFYFYILASHGYPVEPKWWPPIALPKFHNHLKTKVHGIGERKLHWEQKGYSVALYILVFVRKRWGPGRAIKQSEWRAISAFLWCILATGLTSPTVSPVIYGSNIHITIFRHTMKQKGLNFQTFSKKDTMKLKKGLNFKRVQWNRITQNIIQRQKEEEKRTQRRLRLWTSLPIRVLGMILWTKIQKMIIA